MVRIPPITRMFEPRHNILSDVRADIRKYVVSWLKHSRESNRSVPGPTVEDKNLSFLFPPQTVLARLRRAKLPDNLVYDNELRSPVSPRTNARKQAARLRPSLPRVSLLLVVKQGDHCLREDGWEVRGGLV